MARKSKSNQLENILYGIMLILIGTIALLHEQTGFLGNIFFRLINALVGYLAYIVFIGMIVVGVVLIMGKRYDYIKVILPLILLLIAILIIFSFNKNLSGLDAINDFLSRIPNLVKGLEISKGGIVGSLLYALISALVSYVGSIIVASILIVAAFLIAMRSFKGFNLPNVNFDKPKLKQISEKTEKKSALFDKIKIKKSPRKKNKTIAIENDIEELPVKQENVVEQQIQFNSSDNNIPVNDENYRLPDYRLILENVAVTKKSTNAKNAAEKWNILSESLESFGLPSTLNNYNIGPTVTQFEIVPNGKFNIRKYATIEENIKMDLAVSDIRIQAPIPGKTAVGIEIPNIERIPVKMRDLIDNIPENYRDNPLTICLGKDLTGHNVYGSIDKYPHLLIAGATGSGKSVCINSIIITLLLRTKPSEVKLLLIDPKKVEFASYAKIPHLIAPIISDTSQAANALKTLCSIMDSRYDKFKNLQVRNISEYNKKTDKKMEYIVCIIDELADLMATHKNDVEAYIQRLASMARACGIYLILATQRPSTDVITGTIKANIVSRIAFAVSSSYDSRTILDQLGAETLFGNGDMLYAPVGINVPSRIQGVYVSDSEIEKCVSSFEKSNYIPRYEDAFLISEESEYGPLGESQCNDPYYDTIKAWVITQKTISASGLQRRYGLGFPRAAKIIDALEQNGIISGSNGSKPRDVLVDYDTSSEQQEDDIYNN